MTCTPISYELVDEPNDASREAVFAVLREYNAKANAEFWGKLDDPAHEARPLNVLACDENGKVAGGLFAETRFAWLKIQIMAVPAELRGRGIGSGLLRVAEREAVRRGCRYAYVDTMDYQSPDFYRGAGYTLAGQLDDWDSHGHAKLLFTKRLAE